MGRVRVTAESTRSRLGLSASSVRLLVALVGVDALFLVLHTTRVRYDLPADDRWLISRDRGYPELFQYGKESAIIVMFVTLVVVQRQLLYAAWAAMFVYLLVDDSLEVHERVGEWLGEWLELGSPLGIDSRDVGQILVSATAGFILVSIVAAAYVGDRSPARSLTHSLLGLIVGLAFFGIVTDVIDIIDLFGIVEDGGEMVTISAMVVLVFDHRGRIEAQARSAEIA